VCHSPQLGKALAVVVSSPSSASVWRRHQGLPVLARFPALRGGFLRSGQWHTSTAVTPPRGTLACVTVHKACRCVCLCVGVAPASILLCVRVASASRASCSGSASCAPRRLPSLRAVAYVDGSDSPAWDTCMRHGVDGSDSPAWGTCMRHGVYRLALWVCRSP